MDDKTRGNVLYFPTPENPIYRDAGVTEGFGHGFFWYSTTPELIAAKQKQASSAIASDSNKPKDGQRSWQYIATFYRVNEIVTLQKFLQDFDLNSVMVLGPKTYRDRALTTLGFLDSEEDRRKAGIAERHDRLVSAIRQAAASNSAFFIHFGNEYIEDLSCGETRFHFVFLDIPKLFYWIVNESGMDKTWIPYPITQWVRKIHGTLKTMNEQFANAESQAAMTHSSGFENPSVQTKICDATYAAGWGRSTAATKKMREYMKNNPDFARSVPKRKGYYWFNRDFSLASKLPENKK